MTDDAPHKDVNGTVAFWKVLPKSRRVAYTPTELMVAAIEYFDWCHANPLFGLDIRTTKEDGIVETPVPKARVFTLGGLLNFLNIGYKTFRRYNETDEYQDVTEWIANVIRTQKFEYAAAGLLNANLIARDLGLADTVKQEHTSPDGSMTPKGLNVDWSRVPLEARVALLDAIGDPDAEPDAG